METFSRDVKPKELEEVLRLEYRSKLLNPKWAKVCCSSLKETDLSRSRWGACETLLVLLSQNFKESRLFMEEKYDRR